MIYYYQEKIKFKHLILDPSLIGYNYNSNNYNEKVNWLKDNISECKKRWTTSYGYWYNGKKYYAKDFRSNEEGYSKYTFGKFVTYSKQWCFLYEADALHFKLRWS